MPIKKFNAVAGISVGDDVIFEVIDDTANVTANNLTVTATTALGDLANVKIDGGSTGYVIRTDGLGNLSWENPADVGVVGNDTEIQFNDGGLFGAVPEFTFNKTSNTLTVTGNISVTDNILRDDKNVTTFFSGTSSPSNPKPGDQWYNTNNDVIYQYIYDGSAYAWIDSSSGFISASIEAVENTIVVRDANASIFGNVVVGNLFTGTLTTNSQPNITSVGALTGLQLTGDLTPTANVTYDLGNTTHRFKDLWLSGQTIQMDGATIEVSNDTIVLTNPAGGQFIVDGSTTQFSSVASTVSTNAQPNITSVGTLLELSIDGGDLTIANANLHITTASKGIFVDNLYHIDGSPWDFQQPSGTDTEIVFNDGGDFGGSADFTFDKTSNTLTVGNNISNTTLSGGDIDTSGDISGNNLSITSLIQSEDGFFSGNIDVSGNISASLGTVTANKGVFYDDTSVTGGNLSLTGGGHFEINGSTIDLVNNQAGVFNTGITDINIGLGANVNLSATGLLTTVNGHLKTNGNLEVTGNLSAGNIQLTGSNVANSTVTNTLTVNNLKVSNILSNRAKITVTSDTVIDSFPINRYRSAKYTIRVASDDGYQAIEVLLVHDDVEAFVTIYGSLSTSGSDMVFLTANLVGTTVSLLATATTTNTNVNMIASYVTD